MLCVIIACIWDSVLSRICSLLFQKTFQKVVYFFPLTHIERTCLSWNFCKINSKNWCYILRWGSVLSWNVLYPFDTGPPVVKTCEDTQFNCTNKNCVAATEVCDDTNDCGDWSDESGCRKYPLLSPTTACSPNCAIAIS